MSLPTRYTVGDLVSLRKAAMTCRVLEVLDGGRRYRLDTPEGARVYAVSNIRPARQVIAARGMRGGEPRECELKAHRMWEEGLSYRQIARELGMSSERVREWIGNVQDHRTAHKATG